MTTIKTDDLTPRQINMLVAVAEGWVPPTDPLIGELRKLLVDADRPAQPLPIWLPRRDLDARFQYGPPEFCTSDRDAGPIIDRERIATVPWGSMDEGLHAWASWFDGNPCIEDDPEAYGATRLEAAMRAYVHKRYAGLITTTDKPWLQEAAAA